MPSRLALPVAGADGSRQMTIETEQEAIYNIFLDVVHMRIMSIGVKEHYCGGSDQSKIEFLKGAVEQDVKVALRFPVPPNINPDMVLTDENGIRTLSWEGYATMSEMGKTMILLDPILEYFNYSLQPLMVVTPVVDGKIDIVGSTPIYNNPTDLKEIRIEAPKHFLEAYTEGA